VAARQHAALLQSEFTHPPDVGQIDGFSTTDMSEGGHKKTCKENWLFIQYLRRMQSAFYVAQLNFKGVQLILAVVETQTFQRYAPSVWDSDEREAFKRGLRWMLK
jgi:hypothetical protein